MNYEEFIKKHKEQWHFFLSELFVKCPEDAGYIVELMRAIHHIVEFRKLLLKFSPKENGDEDAEGYQVAQNDSTIVFLFNLSAAQLREVLKLFYLFTKTKSYLNWVPTLATSDKKEIEYINKFISDFEKKDGFLFNVLKPLRDSVFHYDPKSAKVWVEKIANEEKNEKPPSYSIDVKDMLFGPALEYDNFLFSNYIFFGSDGLNSLGKHEKLILETQDKLLKVICLFVEYLINEAKIPKRQFGWLNEYFYGYNPKS